MWRMASTACLKLAERHCRATSRLTEVTRASSSLSFGPWKSSICGTNSGNSHLPLGSSDRSETRRFLSSTPRNKRHQEKSKQIEINRYIVALGKKNDWAGILDLHEKEKEQFNHVNYATSMSQLGRIQSVRRDDTRLEAMIIDIATRLHNNPTTGSWDAREISNVLHAVAKLQLDSNGTRRLADSILGEENLKVLVDNGNSQDIANTAWSFAKLGVACPSLFKAIDNNALYLVENGNCQEIANTAWACAKLGFECPSLFNAIDKIASNLVDNGNCQDISNTAWAFATLGVQSPSVFNAIDKNALYLVENGTSQNFSNTMWACATLGVQCPLLFKAIDNNALYLVENGNSQHISNTAWAFATLGVESPLLFKAIDKNALYMVEKGNCQDISNTAWAFGTLGVQGPALFRAIEKNALYLVENGTSQHFANTMWACATLGVHCPLLFQAIDNNALYLVENGNSQEIANTAWAYATLGVECPFLFQAIDNHALTLVEKGNSQDIVNIAWACATMRVECPLLFQAIDKHALTLVKKGNSQDIANAAWACATLGVECPVLFQAIGSHMEVLVESCNAQQLAILCFSFAILDLALAYEAQFRILWNRAIMIQLDDLNKEISRQLLQTFVMVSTVMQLSFPTELMNQCQSLCPNESQDSRSQREMSKLLHEMGISHEIEVSPLPPDTYVPGLFAIDAACKDRMIAIEFDGPYHFLKTVGTAGEWLEGRVEDGPSKAKRLFLERLGWKVVNVPYWEWASSANSNEKQKLLAAKLDAINDTPLA